MVKTLPLVVLFASCTFGVADPTCLNGERLQILSVVLLNDNGSTLDLSDSDVVFAGDGRLAVELPGGDQLEFSDLQELIRTREGTARYVDVFPDGSSASGAPIQLEVSAVEGSEDQLRAVYRSQSGDPGNFAELEVVLEASGTCE